MSDLQRLAEKIEARKIGLAISNSQALAVKFELGVHDAGIWVDALEWVLSEIRKMERTFLPKKVHEKTITCDDPYSPFYGQKRKIEIETIKFICPQHGEQPFIYFSFAGVHLGCGCWWYALNEKLVRGEEKIEVKK